MVVTPHWVQPEVDPSTWQSYDAGRCPLSMTGPLPRGRQWQWRHDSSAQKALHLSYRYRITDENHRLGSLQFRCHKSPEVTQRCRTGPTRNSKENQCCFTRENSMFPMIYILDMKLLRYHNAPSAGHPGKLGMYVAIAKDYWARSEDLCQEIH